MRSKTLLANEDFVARVQEYFTEEAQIFATDADGKPDGEQTLDDLRQDNFYLLNSDALLALTQAIEDVALDEANGSLLASMQDFKNFEPHNERFWQLSATLSEVKVVGKGETPRRHGHVQFSNAGKAVSSCWSVIYRGRRVQAMLLAEQTEDAEDFEGKKFLGFYTFNGALVGKALEDFENVLGERCPELQEFKRLQKIDSLAKKIKVEFSREQEAVEIAIKKLVTESDDYRAEQFTADLDEAISHLEKWKKRAREMLT